jgi:hypothetical protein
LPFTAFKFQFIECKVVREGRAVEVLNFRLFCSFIDIKIRVKNRGSLVLAKKRPRAHLAAM